MIRHFFKTKGLTCSNGSAQIAGAFTIAGIARNISGKSMEFYTSENDTDLAPWHGMNFRLLSGTKLSISVSGLGFTEVTLSTMEQAQWGIFVATKPSGTSKVTYYYYSFKTKKWEIIESSGTNVNPGGAGNQIRIMHFVEETWGGDVAAVAVWNAVLSTAEVESLAKAKSIESWLTSPKVPVALWMFEQNEVSEAINDQTGNGANQSAIEGTSVVAEAPPIPYRPGKVQILKGGSLKQAVRWVLRGGKLVKA